MSTKAATLTNQIISYLYKNNAYGWRASTAGVYDSKRQTYRMAAKKGVADILACYKGRFIAIEVKIGADKLSPEQTGFLKNIEYYGGLSFVAKDFESFKDWFTKTVMEIASN